MPPKSQVKLSPEEDFHKKEIQPLAQKIVKLERNPLSRAELTLLIVKAPANYKMSEEMKAVLTKGSVDEEKEKEEDKGKGMAKRARRVVTSQFNWKTWECSKATAALTRSDFRLALERLKVPEDLKQSAERFHHLGSIARPALDLMASLPQAPETKSVLRGGANPLLSDAQMLKLGEDYMKVALTHLAILRNMAEMGEVSTTKGRPWEEITADLCLWTMDENQDDVTAFNKYMTKDGNFNLTQEDDEDCSPSKKKGRKETTKTVSKGTSELPWHPKKKETLLAEGVCFYCDDKGHRGFACKDKKYRGPKPS